MEQKPNNSISQSTSLNPLPLREQFRQALKVRDLSDRTVQAYIAAMAQFADFCPVPPLRADLNHIRAFLYCAALY